MDLRFQSILSNTLVTPYADLFQDPSGNFRIESANSVAVTPSVPATVSANVAGTPLLLSAFTWDSGVSAEHFWTLYQNVNSSGPIIATQLIVNPPSGAPGDLMIVNAPLTAANLTDSALTSGNCVQASTGGLLTTTGGPCGAAQTYPGANTIGVANSGNTAWRTPLYSDITALFGSGSCSGALMSSGGCTALPSVGTWGALNYPTWVSGTPFVKMTAAGTFALDTNTYLTSSGVSGMTAGQVPIAATATTITSSKALAGSGAGITTGPTSSTSGDLMSFTGAGGQAADSGIAASNVPLLSGANAFTGTGTSNTFKDSAGSQRPIVLSSANTGIGNLPVIFSVSPMVLEDGGIAASNVPLLNAANTFTATNTFNNATYSALFTGGPVGIGTTSPVRNLSVVGSTRVPGIDYGLFSVSDEAGLNMDMGVNTAGAYSWIQSGIDGIGYNILSLNSKGGNVGIGTTSPAAPLQVTSVTNGVMFQVGNAFTFGNNSGGSGSSEIHSLATNTDFLGKADNTGAFNFYGGGAYNSGAGIGLHGSSYAGFGGSNTISFFSGAFIEEMRMSATGGFSLGDAYVATDPGAGSMIISGNVGIGTTSPTHTLEVNGTFQSGTATLGAGSTASNGSAQQAICLADGTGCPGLAHSDYASIQGSLFATNTMRGPVFAEPLQVHFKTIIVRLSGTISCTGAPVVSMMDLGTSPSTAFGSAIGSVAAVTTGTSDGVYQYSASVNMAPGDYYGFAFTGGTCVTAPTFDITAQVQ
jgi:hypothetical protein